VANTLKLLRNGAVGFIEWLDVPARLMLLTFDILIEEPKHIVLPLRHRKIEESVSVLRNFND
jgi:hypothetical protein